MRILLEFTLVIILGGIVINLIGLADGLMAHSGHTII